MNRRLTLELGLRITHFTPWADNLGFGFSIFDYSKYNSSCTPTQYCGFLWNKRDPSVPLGGFPTARRLLPAALRRRLRPLGTRQDRAARRLGPLLLPLRPVHHRPECFGRHADRHPEQQPGHRRQYPAAGQRTRHPELRHLRRFPSAAWIARTTRTPYTDSYSFTISQRVPWSGLLEVAYVGNQSRDLAQPAAAWAATSTWCRWARCCRRRTAAWTPTV